MASAAFTAGRAEIASNQRVRFGLSVNGTPWASWLRVHGKVAMSAIEYSLAAEIRRLAEPLLEHVVEPLHLALVAVEAVLSPPFGANILKCVSCPNIGPTPVTWIISHWITS